MSILQFSSKAKTLQSLEGVVKSAGIANLIIFKVSEFNLDKDTCIKRILNNFKCELFIVRSSAIGEDGATCSNAGAFLSVPNVDRTSLKESIQKVIDSYEKPHPDDEVFVQPMLENVIRSGVAFSHDPNTCSPYRVINWNEGNDTHSVTSGLGGQIWQQAAKSEIKSTSKFDQIILLLEELLGIFGNTPLDCEFAVTKGNKEKEILWLLQVRRLILKKEP